MAACPVCGIDESALSVGDATDAVRTFPRRFRDALADTPDDHLRLRPVGEPTSMLGATVAAREALGLLAKYLPAVLTDSEPAFPPSEVFAAAVSSADGAAPADLAGTLAGISSVCDDLVAQITEVPLAAWDRPFTIGDDTHRALWIPRRAAHEGAHHLRDVARIRAVVTA